MLGVRRLTPHVVTAERTLEKYGGKRDMGVGMGGGGAVVLIMRRGRGRP